MATTLKPTADKVFLKRFARDASEGGILLAGADFDQAEVVAVGPKVTDVKPGDRVVIDEVKVTWVTVDQQRYLVMRDEDILAALEA